MCYVCHQSRLDEGDEPTEIQELVRCTLLSGVL
jgi:hypothetical protein